MSGATLSGEPGELEDDLDRALQKVTDLLPGGGEHRNGQRQMAHAVAGAVTTGRNLVVQAGTGTGKSLAYLIPVVLSGRTTVVATATKALQDQLATKDLPLLSSALGGGFRFAVLKGRSNYVCRQRVAEMRGQLDLGTLAPGEGTDDGAGADEGSDDDRAGYTNGAGGTPTALRAPSPSSPRLADQVRSLMTWSDKTSSGDRAELDFEPSSRAWSMVSVTARECPGAFHCPSGGECFTEHARGRAAAADVIVVNTHLYATHVASDGAVLPEHDVVVLDEAHAVEDVMTAGLGIELTPGRVRAAAALARGLLLAEDTAAADSVIEVADRLQEVLGRYVGRRVLHDGDGASELPEVLALAANRTESLSAGLRRGAGDGADAESAGRRARALVTATHLGEDLNGLSSIGPDRVSWVESSGAGRHLTLRAAPVDVGSVLALKAWPSVTAILTSATIPPRLGSRLGLARGDTDRLDVGSPFPYETCSLLYCPVDLPDRRGSDAEVALQGELRMLMEAAGGRTLALFTSWRAMRAAVDALRPLVAFTVLAQDDLPKSALLEAFRREESACLFATMSFWQGIDVPGATLSLVTVDRLPFPRPDDPLLQARRERAGSAAFNEVDLPRAATLLAQGAGRLIRKDSDRGVVAVLDRRLATSSYGGVLRAAMAPMPFTTDRGRVLRFLEQIAADQ